jgi:hypothetical protein
MYGYQIWRFADSSIFFKLEVWVNTSNAGSGGVYANHFYLTVGEGSDGAGNITGTMFPRTRIVDVSGAPISPTANYLSRMAWDSDYFAIINKIGAFSAGNSPCHLGFVIEKMKDKTGAVSGQGYVVSWVPQTQLLCMNKRAIRTAAPITVFGASANYSVVPGGVTSSTDTGGDKQCWRNYVPGFPDDVASDVFVTIVAAEYADGVSLPAFAPIGATTHNYMSISNNLGSGFASSATWAHAMRWDP